MAVKRVPQTSEYALVGAMEVAVMHQLRMAALSSSDKGYDFLLMMVGWYLEDDAIYVVTDYMPGGTLSTFLQSLDTSSDQAQLVKLRSFVRQITNGMLCLEKHGLVHRDLAARNILLTENEQIKVYIFLSQFT